MAEKRDSNDVVSSYPFSEDDGSNGSDDSDGEDSFVCSDCDREFETKRGLNIHRGQQHDRDGE
ncbi:hypothetical protein [Halorubrum sp. CBA1229]|jgi:hypothetical protein|uniref:hypothetical protein n=1 Tax=Halorubrum sp. CBA1229 TaxID=1853699 RepID=UPI000F3C888C|nr:hypothetical protein [Halorubrum sp. CBA1229]QKY17241.1 hypothetical protein Hrr1229_010215 [Halorubrum sp. CBA1229]